MPLRSAARLYENTDTIEAFRPLVIQPNGPRVALERHVRIDELQGLPCRDRSASARAHAADLRRRFHAIYGNEEAPTTRLTDELIEQAESLHLRIVEGQMVGIERAPVLGWTSSPGEETPDFIHIRLGEIAIEEIQEADPFHPADKYVMSNLTLQAIAVHPAKNRILTRLVREIPGGIDAASVAFTHRSVRQVLG